MSVPPTDITRSHSAGFREKPDHELNKLPDERLIAYLREAAGAGERAAARHALAILVYGHAANVERRLALRMPRWAVQDAAHDALVRAITSAFDGASEGEFRGWLNTITDRTAVDWFRQQGRRPVETPLPSEHAGSDEIWGDEPSVASEDGLVDLRLVIEEMMADLSATHQEAIEFHLFQGFSAPETCERVEGMSPDNVAQIASRFRRRLRGVLASSNESRQS